MYSEYIGRIALSMSQKTQSVTKRSVCGGMSIEETTQTTKNRQIHRLRELRLRPHVHWTEDTIDNEHMNKRKSKSSVRRHPCCVECCVFHKHTEFGESSPECSSESDLVDSSDVSDN